MELTFQGKKLDVTEIDVLSSSENWNTYQLSDGTVLKIKLVVETIYKANGVLNDRGEPLYVTKSQNVLNVNLAK